MVVGCELAHAGAKKQRHDVDLDFVEQAGVQ